ncbi:hypothetical protein MKK84_24035 [Methylobacterium sp. E-065]|uniref:hypothetical protein n=1 Tax=Methylobacterium sp. E-065 TaxID=2836583 RepID=UPI001FB94876|nr:hypothetical protein [Methylobacterium sp. E-065]MCJ2020463.1 hypothetical protein [Methylobacterium sp. E-065]
MAQIDDLAAAALGHNWAQLSEVGAAVRRSLDDALADLVRVAADERYLCRWRSLMEAVSEQH